MNAPATEIGTRGPQIEPHTTRPVSSPLARVRAFAMRGGLVTREMLAGAPPALLIAFIPSLLLAISHISLGIQRISGGFGTLARSTAQAGVTGLVVAFYTIPLMLAALSGAGDEENGTADFIYRLPLSRLRIFTAKLVAALLTYLISGAAAVGLLLCTARIMDGRAAEVILQIQLVNHGHIFYMPTFFCLTFTASLWMRRVLPGALVGGLSALLFIVISYALLGEIFAELRGRNWQELNRDHIAVCNLMLINVLALMLAWTRIARREGK